MPRNPNSQYFSSCDFSAHALTNANENIKLQAMIAKLEKSLSNSTYHIWLDNGHEGTEKDFLEWLVGPPTTIVIDGKEYKYVWDTREVDLSAAFVPYKTGLDQEIQRSTAEDFRLSELITSTVRSIQQELNLLYNSLDAETASRLANDRDIQTALKTEVLRAEQRELDLEQAINKAIVDLTALVNAKCAIETATRETGLTQLTNKLETTETTLDNKINTEIAKCIDADEELRGELNIEIVAREEALAEMQTKLDAEATTARLNEDDLDKKISAETKTRTNEDLRLGVALNAEKAEREAADQTLTANLNHETARAQAEERRIDHLVAQNSQNIDLNLDAINAEATARIAATSELNSKLASEISRASQKETALETEFRETTNELFSSIDTKISEERQARETHIAQLASELTNVESNLTTAINTEINTRKGEVSQLVEDLNFEITSRENSITELQADLTKEANTARDAEDKLNQKLSKEILDRSNADLALNARLTGEENARIAADNLNTQAILDEAVARQSADNTILNTIGGGFDTVNTIAKVISVEQQARVASDSALDTRLVEVETTLDVFFKDAARDGEGLEKALDTLKEIQTFINTDETTAAKMVSDIAQNASNIAIEQARAEKAEESLDNRLTAIEVLLPEDDTPEGSPDILPEDPPQKILATTNYVDKAVTAEREAREDADIFYTDILTVNSLGGIKANVDLNGMTVREVLTTLLYPYVQFVLGSTSRSAAAATLENGATQTLSSATITVTKKSKPITSIQLLNGTTVIEEKTGDAVKNGGTITFNGFEAITVSKTNNPNLKFTVTDGETSDSKNIGASTFVYPYYWGTCAKNATIDEDLVESLTKKIESKGNKTDVSFTCADEHMVFAYPKTHGVLKSIIDPNNFEIINDFTCHEISITGLDGTAQTYYVYVSGASTVTSFKVDFKY